MGCLLARLVVTAVKIEGRTKASVARDYGMARSWVHELMHRYECEGEAGLEGLCQLLLRRSK